MGEILLIAVVALLVVGPDRLPATAKAIGKGIRDLRASTKDLQSTIEQDTQIGDAVRELKGALRGDPESLYKRATGEDFHANPKKSATGAEVGSEDGESEFPPDGDAASGDAAKDTDGASSKVPGGDSELGSLLDDAYANSNDPWGTEAVNPHLAEEAAASNAAEAHDPDLPLIKPPAGSVARTTAQESDEGEDETGSADTSSHG